MLANKNCSINVYCTCDIDGVKVANFNLSKYERNNEFNFSIGIMDAKMYNDNMELVDNDFAYFKSLYLPIVDNVCVISDEVVEPEVFTEEEFHELHD